MFKRIEKSFAAKLSFYVIASSTIVGFIMFILFFNFTTRRLERNVDERVWNIAEKVDLRLSHVLGGIEKIPVNMAWMVSDGLLEPDSVFGLTRRIVQFNPEVFGCAIAFEPYYFKSKGYYFAPYSYMRGDSVVTVQIGGEEYDYFLKRWYIKSKEKGISRWTQPYRDNGDNEVITSSYSVPMYDNYKQFIGIFSVDLSTNWLTDLIDSIKPYPLSYALIVDSLGNYIVHRKEKNMLERTIFDVAKDMSDTTALWVAQQITRGMRGKIRFKDEGIDSYIYYMPLKATQWNMAIVCPYKDVYRSLIKFNIVLWMGFVLLLLSLYFVISSTLRRLMVPLKEFAWSARRIAHGNFDVNLPKIRSKDEMGELYASFDYMQSQLRMFIQQLQETTIAKEKIESELRIAHDIQIGLVPGRTLPVVDRENMDVCAVLSPAKQVGGDFYDYLLEGNKFYFAIGDVSGKGVPSSLLMATTLSLLRSIEDQHLPLAEITDFINKGLIRSSHADMFVTFFMGILHLDTGLLEYCNAGHTAPVVITSNGMVTFLNIVGSLPLGIWKDYHYEAYNCQLEVGSRLLLYTDGVTEAENERQILYTKERLLQVVKRNVDLPLKVLVEKVSADIRLHIGEVEQSDDITLLAISYIQRDMK